MEPKIPVKRGDYRTATFKIRGTAPLIIIRGPRICGVRAVYWR